MRKAPAPIRWAEAVVSLGEWLAAAILLMIVIVIDVEIVRRLLGMRSLHVAEEYSAYGMVAIVFLAAGAALLGGVHVRVNIFQARLNATGKKWLEMVALVVGLLVVAVIFVTFLDFFLGSYRSGVRSITVARTPLYLPLGVALVGVGLFLLSFVILLIKQLMTWSRGEPVEE